MKIESKFSKIKIKIQLAQLGHGNNLATASVSLSRWRPTAQQQQISPAK